MRTCCLAPTMCNDHDYVAANQKNDACESQYALQWLYYKIGGQIKTTYQQKDAYDDRT